MRLKPCAAAGTPTGSQPQVIPSPASSLSHRVQEPVREIAEQERYTFEPPLRYGSMGQRAILVLRSDHARSKSYKDCFEHVTPIGPLDRVAARHSLEKYMVYLAVTPTAALAMGSVQRSEDDKGS